MNFSLQNSLRIQSDLILGAYKTELIKNYSTLCQKIRSDGLLKLSLLPLLICQVLWHFCINEEVRSISIVIIPTAIQYVYYRVIHTIAYGIVTLIKRQGSGSL